MFGIYFRYLADRVIHLFVYELRIGVVQSVAFANCFRLYADFTSSFALDSTVISKEWNEIPFYWSGWILFRVQGLVSVLAEPNLPSSNDFLLPVWIRTEKRSIKKCKCICFVFQIEIFILFLSFNFFPFQVAIVNFHKILTIFSICTSIYEIIIWLWIDS